MIKQDLSPPPTPESDEFNENAPSLTRSKARENALRNNLARRKQQQRAREEEPSKPFPDNLTKN